MTEQERVDGHEAYSDDPDYTAPEMEPGHGAVAAPGADADDTVVTGAGMTGGVAGGALAGQIILDEVEEERADTTPNRDPKA